MRKMRVVGAPLVLFGVAWLVVMGIATFGLWNVLMPAILGLHTINFWQALGLFLLSRVLFGRLGGWNSRLHKARFVRGWMQMTPEERGRFRNAMGSGCTGRFGEGETPEKI